MHIRIDMQRTPITTALIEKLRISLTKSKRRQGVRAMLLDRRRRKASRARYSHANTSAQWRDFRDCAETRMNQGSFDCHNFRFR